MNYKNSMYLIVCIVWSAENDTKINLSPKTIPIKRLVYFLLGSYF